MFKLAFLLSVSLFFLQFISTKPAGAADSCSEVFLEQRSILAHGSSSLTNLRLLKNYEQIDPEVSVALNKALSSNSANRRKESQRIALRYVKTPSKRNSEALLEALEVLVPIALRPIAHKIRNLEQFHDMMQVGRLALWQAILSLRKTDGDLLENILYWEGTLHNVRASIFAAMRLEYRSQYSLTPLDFHKGKEFTFREEILLFGDSPRALQTIAKRYDLPLDQVQKEKDLIERSMWEENGQFSTEGTADTLSSQALVQTQNQADRKTLTTRMMAVLPARQKRVIHLRFFENKTLEETGLELKVSGGRVRQLEQKALRRMNHPSLARQARGSDPTNLPITIGPRHIPAQPREYWDPTYRRLSKLEQEQKRRDDLAEKAKRREEQSLIARAQKIETERRIELITELLETHNIAKILEVITLDSNTRTNSYDFGYKEQFPKVEMAGLRVASFDVRSILPNRPWGLLNRKLYGFIEAQPENFNNGQGELTQRSVEDAFYNQREEGLKQMTGEIEQLVATIGRDVVETFDRALEFELQTISKLNPLFEELRQNDLIMQNGEIFPRPTRGDWKTGFRQRDDLPVELEKKLEFYQLRDFFFRKLSQMLEIHLVNNPTPINQIKGSPVEALSLPETRRMVRDRYVRQLAQAQREYNNFVRE